MNSDLIFGRFDKATVIAFACSILLVLVGALAKPDFLSFDYITQQLQTAAFLGIIATGTMLIILLGHIDLSVPWTVALGAMMATGAQGLLGRFIGPDLALYLAIPFGVLCGMLVGLVNGFGVAYLRAPSMIFTLGVNAVAQGLMVYHTGGFTPQDKASPIMRELAVGRLIPGIPNPLLLWLLVGAVIVFMLTRTTLGRRIYAIGNNPIAAQFSGVRVDRIRFLLFMLTGLMSGVASVLLTSRIASTRPTIATGFELQVVTMVVLGGVNILGGSGTIAGVVIAAFVMGLLTFGFGLFNVPGIVQSIFIGGLLIGVIALPIVGGKIARRWKAA